MVLIVLAGLIMAYKQLKAVEKELKSNHDWNRRITSFNYSFSTDPDMLEVLSRLDNHLKISSSAGREISVGRINELKSNEYPKIKHDIHFALARLEYMCTAIKNGVADESICRDLLENRTTSFHRFFLQYIESERNRRGSENIFANISHYAREWEKSKSKFERRNKTDK
jgi:hypothetical protein